MPPEEQNWKSLQRQGGGYAYVSKDKLERLERNGVLDLDQPIEYSVSVGSSDGRARAFVELRNAPEQPGEG